MTEWVSALPCLQCDLSGLQGGEKEGEREREGISIERGGNNSGSSQAEVTSQLAGCVNSTSDLYGNRAASSPLPSCALLQPGCGNKGTDIHAPLPPHWLCSCRAVELWAPALDRAGHDRTALAASAGDLGTEDRTLGSEMAQLTWSVSQAVIQTALHLSSQSGSH